nr:unnamed protein product [Spirometra erinaceieuropaei]
MRVLRPDYQHGEDCTHTLTATQQGSYPADVAVCSGDLDGEQEAGAKAQSFPSQLSSTDTELEMAGSGPGHGCTGLDGNRQHLRHVETTPTALERHLVRMNDERLLKRLFYGDVNTSSWRQGGQVRHSKDTLKTSRKRLQVKSVDWRDLVRDHRTWRRTMKAGAAIYEANRIIAAKAEREAQNSQLRIPPNANF